MVDLKKGKENQQIPVSKTTEDMDVSPDSLGKPEKEAKIKKEKQLRLGKSQLKKRPLLKNWLLILKSQPILFGVILFLIFVFSWLIFKRIVSKKQEIISPPSIKKTYETPTVGMEAPNFSLESTDGKELTLADFSGEKGVVVVLLASWHPFSQDALKILETLYKKQRSWVLVPISVQEEKNTVSDFLERGKYSLSVYLDTRGEVGEKYQVTSLPTYYFINKKGIFQEVYIGPLSREEILEKARGL